MMGERTTEQAALFYEFSLERHVPADHLLRSMDRFVDLSSIREHLRPYYSDAFITLKDAERDRFWCGVDRLACDAPVLPMSKGYATNWCRPDMRVTARHLKGGDKLRHATLSGLC